VPCNRKQKAANKQSKIFVFAEFGSRWILTGGHCAPNHLVLTKPAASFASCRLAILLAVERLASTNAGALSAANKWHYALELA
jgi:hypothetical protein